MMNMIFNIHLKRNGGLIYFGDPTLVCVYV